MINTETCPKIMSSEVLCLFYYIFKLRASSMVHGKDDLIVCLHIRYL